MAKNYERHMKRGDTGPAVRASVREDGDGGAPDWSAATVKFILFEIDAESGAMVPVVDAVAGVESPAVDSGVLHYDWAASDSDRIGRFPGMFEVDDGGTVESYPSEGFMWFNIEERGLP